MNFIPELYQTMSDAVIEYRRHSYLCLFELNLVDVEDYDNILENAVVTCSVGFKF